MTEVDVVVHACQSTFCTNSAAYQPGRILSDEWPPMLVVGWCSLCEKYVCSACTFGVAVDEPGIDVAFLTGKAGVCRALHCLRCGTALQQSRRAQTHLLTSRGASDVGR